MQDKMDLLMVGVGGQGILLASELTAMAAFEAGMDVKKSEVHGMAQRGGVVSSHIRLGKKVHSPLIQCGDADVLLAFEQAEALRWIHFLKEKGHVVVNIMTLVPPVGFLKNFEYPRDTLKRIQEHPVSVHPVHAAKIAYELGSSRIVNMVLIGVLSNFLGISKEIWQTAIKKRVPDGTEEINMRAFDAGVSAIS